MDHGRHACARIFLPTFATANRHEALRIGPKVSQQVDWGLSDLEFLKVRVFFQILSLFFGFGVCFLGPAGNRFQDG